MTTEAEAQLAALEAAARDRYVPFFSKAVLLAGLGDEDGSLALVRKARAEGEPALHLSLTASYLTGLLPPPWIARAREREDEGAHGPAVADE